MLPYAQIITQLVLISLNFNIIVPCNQNKRSCSGFGVWNTSEASCVCDENLWGDQCQYGRKRYTAKVGTIYESEGHYHCNSKYMYLIDSQRENFPISIDIHQLATECNWDHLYIYDGKSIYSPLVAAFSGELVADDSSSSSDVVKTIQTKSGAAFLYYYSDANLIDIGFNISYRISECSGSFCNNHGICESIGECKCDIGWSGTKCSQKICCRDSFDLLDGQGNLCGDCGFSVQGRASHAVAKSRSGHTMWVYGGISNGNFYNLLMYDLIKRSWIDSKTVPISERYGHSMIFYADQLFVFGGTMGQTISKDTSLYNIKTNSWWEKIPTTGIEPIGLTGHAAVEIAGWMYIFFGFNEEYSLVNTVLKLSLDAPYEWTRVKTKGAVVFGRYGHTATFDMRTDSVYICGGYLQRNITSELLMFHQPTKTWSLVKPSLQASMLHSAGIIGRNLVIYGGNAHGTSQMNNKNNQCYSSNVLIYNIDCKKWIKLDQEKEETHINKYRYGHSAVAYNSSIYIFGGFDGTYKNDVFEITIEGGCQTYQDLNTCLKAPTLAGCVWNKNTKECIDSKSVLPESSIERPNCDASEISCDIYNSCSDCTGANCVWQTDASRCDEKSNGLNDVTDIEKCIDYNSKKCWVHQNCYSCNQAHDCNWKRKHSFDPFRCYYSKGIQNRTACYGNSSITSCGSYKDCHGCYNQHGSHCMWCESMNICVDSRNYVLHFPYGQCLEWISNNTGSCKETRCELQNDCQSCFQLPGCGWCDDGSNTGLGKCMKGNDNAPLNATQCPINRWKFTDCPACHCNGHSTCINGTDTCKRCYNGVIGKHCNKCEKGFYGDPSLNGSCQACTCNGHLRSCSMDGTCQCNLQGAIGKYCERCNEDGDYIGNATDGGVCFVYLSVDFEYKMDLSDVNLGVYVGKPRSQNKKFKFEINRISGGEALLNLSIYYANGKTTVLKTRRILGEYRLTIDDDSYEYNEEAELRAFVYGWQEDQHFEFKISFSHPPQIFDLVYFLIMFLVCFCSLLFLLIVLWKIKQRYDSYILNRRQRHEHEERISRPFKTVSVVLRGRINKTTKVLPTQIACEQFSNGHLAVASYLIELPRDKNGYTPPGQSGLCIGTTLIVNPNKKPFSQIHSNPKNRRQNRRTRAVPV